MRHVPVFLSLASLLFGMACLARLSFAHAIARDKLALSRLAFFSAYTYLLAVGFAFSYYVINVGQGLASEYAFASLIFVDMGAVEILFPWMLLSSAEPESAAPPAGASPGATASLRGALKRRPLLIWAAALTAAQAGSIWILSEDLGFIALGLAFLPFSAVIAWSLAKARSRASSRKSSGLERKLIFLYVPVFALAALELSTQMGGQGEDPYVPLSLPVAYALTALQFWLNARAPARAAPSTPAELPRALVDRAGLSPREAEMAGLILQGKVNKEIASALSLSENTVRNHIYALYKKLGIQRRMDLLRLIRDEDSKTGTKIPGPEQREVR